MESAAPGDLPGSDVNQDEIELQQQLTHLDRNNNRVDPLRTIVVNIGCTGRIRISVGLATVVTTVHVR